MQELEWDMCKCVLLVTYIYMGLSPLQGQPFGAWTVIGFDGLQNCLQFLLF